MASFVFDTGVPSHPTISIDGINLVAGKIDFHWVGAGHSGDCNESFLITLADHGDMTVNQVTDLFIAHMVAMLTGEASE